MRGQAMKQNNSFEILLSAAVIVVAAGFFLFAYTTTGGAALTDYGLTVRMAHADGLAPGSDVRIGGVKVGDVSGLELEHYTAVVRIRVRDEYRIPRDSALSISADGLTPGSYLAISPGHSSDMLAPGAVFTAPK
jgi:phospholipid/cholesterol/gamma-HCH transport system substrate-binding protein